MDDDIAAGRLWDRLIESIMLPWTIRLEMVNAAHAEVRGVLDRSRSLAELRRDRRRVDTLRSQALDEQRALLRRRDEAIELAAQRAASRGLVRRSARVAEARARARQSQDEQTRSMQRLLGIRLGEIEREAARLEQDLAPLERVAMLQDDLLLDWLTMLSGTLAATIDRDEGRGERVRAPWKRRRDEADAVAARLHQLVPTGQLATDVAFGVGPIHLLGDRGLTVVEVRPGHDRGEDLDGDDTRRLRRIATEAAACAAQAAAADTVVCFTGAPGSSRLVDGTRVCGPTELTAVLAQRSGGRVDAAGLARAVEALGALPLPQPAVPPPPPLTHLLPVTVPDVPETMTALRRLVMAAHQEARSARALATPTPAGWS